MTIRLKHFAPHQISVLFAIVALGSILMPIAGADETPAPQSGQASKSETQNPSEGSAYSRLTKANALYEANSYTQAKLEFERSLEAKPTPEAYIGLGKVMEKLEGIQAGKSDYEEAVKLDPNSSVAHRQLGLYYYRIRNLAEANHELSASLILDSEDREAARCLIDLWQEQVKNNPSANAHFGLARAYQLSGALDLAQSEYRTVVKLDANYPGLPQARKSFHFALAHMEAEKDLAKAEVLEQEGKINDACQLVAQAMVFSPGNTDYKIYQAELLSKLGQPELARQIYINVLKDEPYNMTALKQLDQISNSAYKAPATWAASTGSAKVSKAMLQGLVSTSTTAEATSGSLPSGGVQGTVESAPQNAQSHARASATDVSGANTMYSLLGFLRNKVFDQTHIESDARNVPEPVANPEGMFHGLTPTTIEGQGKLNSEGKNSNTSNQEHAGADKVESGELHAGSPSKSN